MVASPQTAQGARQASVRAVTGSAESYEGDWHRLFDLAGIAANDGFNGRLLRWINLKLSASYTNLPEAQQALATATGAYNFSSLGTFDASTSATTFTPAFWDDFSRTATLGGVTVNGLLWTFDKGSSSAAVANTTSLNAAGLGRINAATGANSNNTYIYVTAPVTTSKWHHVRTDTAAATALTVVNVAQQITYNGAGAWDRFTQAVISASLRGSYGKAVAATAAGTIAAQALTMAYVAGDNEETRTYPGTGANLGKTLADLYYNGQLVTQATDYTTPAVTFNGTHGFLGTTPNASFRYIEVGDPDTQAMIRLQAPNRIAPVDLNGDLTLHFVGDFSQASLTSVTYSIYDASTDLVVAAASSVAVTGLVASAGRWHATGTKLAAASIPATFYVKATRSDITGSSSISTWGPVQRPGIVDGTYGQSLGQQAWAATTGGSVAAPAQAYTIDGSTGASTGSAAVTSELNARVRAMVANTPNATWAATILTALGGTVIGRVRGGVGGTNAYERLPGSSVYASFMLGIERAGGDIQEISYNGGTYDAQNATGNGSVADYTANLNLTCSTMETDLGKAANSLIVQLVGLGTVKSGATDANQQAIRRQHVVLANSGGRYYRGPDTAHLQHNSTDAYHLINQAYNEQERLVALARLDHLLGGTTYKRGPTLVSAAKVDAQTLTVTFDCPNAASMTALNTGNGQVTAFDGGMRFATSAANLAAGTLVHATSISFAAVSGGQCVATVGFAAGTFTGVSGYVGGPYGTNPFNPTNDVTIENAGIAGGAATATGKNWWAGVYTGEENVAIQSYFNTVTGNDYLVAS